MASTFSQSPAVEKPTRQSPLFLIGFLFFLLGPALYAAQVYRGQLQTPWFVPGLATIGLLCMAISFWQRKGILRGIGLAFFTAFCGFQWFMLAIFTATPAYTGPAKEGNTVPAFSSTLANGQTFSDADLAAGKATLVHFYRGQWCGICRIELGELERRHEDFAKRGIQIVAISNDDLPTSEKMQAKHPHLKIVSDTDQKAAKAFAVIHPGAHPDGSDTNAPTTFLVDGTGKVRWLFRTDRIMTRISPDELLAAIDKNMPSR